MVHDASSIPKPSAAEGGRLLQIPNARDSWTKGDRKKAWGGTLVLPDTFSVKRAIPKLSVSRFVPPAGLLTENLLNCYCSLCLLRAGQKNSRTLQGARRCVCLEEVILMSCRDPQACPWPPKEKCGLPVTLQRQCVLKCGHRLQSLSIAPIRKF